MRRPLAPHNDVPHCHYIRIIEAVVIALVQQFEDFTAVGLLAQPYVVAPFHFWLELTVSATESMLDRENRHHTFALYANTVVHHKMRAKQRVRANLQKEQLHKRRHTLLGFGKINAPKTRKIINKNHPIFHAPRLPIEP